MESISTAIAKFNYPEQTSLAIQQAFEPFEKQAKEWESKAMALVVTDISQVSEMKDARAARLALRQIRLNVAKKHEEEKADVLKHAQLLDLIKRTLTGYIEPLEAHLQAQEDFAKVQEEKNKHALLVARMEALKPYRVQGDRLELVPFDQMDESAFQTILMGMQAAKEKREADAAELLRIREENERKAKEERDRIKADNLRLQKINARGNRLTALGFKWHEEDKSYKFQLNDGPINVFGDLAGWSDEDFNKTVANAEHYIKIFNDQKKKEADELASKLKAETEARERLEREKREREAKEETERKAKAAAERKAKRAPDKIKLLNFAERLELLEPVELKDDQARMIYTDAVNRIKSIVVNIRDKSEQL